MDDLKKMIREVPDFPRQGINFYDITPLLGDAEGFRKTIDRMAEMFAGKQIDKVVGIGARGFIFGAAVAYKLGVGLVVVRKKGKLPHKTISQGYDLEYNSGIIEMHEDAVKSGERILVIDDVLATGGTAKATADMVEKLGGEIIGIGLLIELSALGGREKLERYDVRSLIRY